MTQENEKIIGRAEHFTPLIPLRDAAALLRRIAKDLEDEGDTPGSGVKLAISWQYGISDMDEFVKAAAA